MNIKDKISIENFEDKGLRSDDKEKNLDAILCILMEGAGYFVSGDLASKNDFPIKYVMKNAA